MSQLAKKCKPTKESMSNHQLTGIILAKELKKVYHKESKYCGNSFYRLTILTEPKGKEEHIFVYPNVVNSTIFQTIEQSKYVDHRYLFCCQKKPKRLVLIAWEELALPNQPAFLQPKAQESLNYEERN